MITNKSIPFRPKLEGEFRTRFYTVAELLDEGYKGYFIIVSLNPYVKAIKLLQDTEVITQLNECITRGLIVKGFCCRLSADGLPQITREIPVQA